MYQTRSLKQIKAGTHGAPVVNFGKPEAMRFKDSAAERGIINELRQRAQVGGREAGYLVDEATGKVLISLEAHPDTPFEVEFPVVAVKEAEAAGRKVAFVHSHPVNSPPSETDWANVVDFPAVARYLTVCGDTLFVLERQVFSGNPHRSSALLVFLFELSQLLAKSSVGKLPLRQALREIPEDELFDLLRAVNRKMAETYQVRFWEVPL